MSAKYQMIPSPPVPGRMHSASGNLRYSASAPHLGPEVSPSASPRLCPREIQTPETNQDQTAQLSSRRRSVESAQSTQVPLVAGRPQRPTAPTSPKTRPREIQVPEANHGQTQDHAGQPPQLRQSVAAEPAHSPPHSGRLTSEPGQTTQIPVVTHPSRPRSPKPGYANSAPKIQIQMPAQSSRRQVPMRRGGSPTPRSVSSAAAESQYQAASPPATSQPRTFVVERKRSSSPGHVVQGPTIQVRRDASRDSSPRVNMGAQGKRVASPHAFGAFESSPRSWVDLSRQPAAWKMEVQNLVSVFENQHAQQVGTEIATDDEHQIKLHMQRVHEVVSTAKESEVRELCASLACQLAKQATSLRILTNIMDALQQQVQTLLRSTHDTLVKDSEILNTETDDFGPTQKDSILYNQDLWDGVDSIIANKIASRESELKSWFGNCCVDAMKETFGMHLQKHEDAIKSLHSQVGTLGDFVGACLDEPPSGQSSYALRAQTGLDTITELPDQDSDAADQESEVVSLGVDSDPSSGDSPDQMHTDFEARRGILTKERKEMDRMLSKFFASE